MLENEAHFVKAFRGKQILLFQSCKNVWLDIWLISETTFITDFI